MPPATDRGAENSAIIKISCIEVAMFRIHWFSITVFDNPDRMAWLWSEFFGQLGLLVHSNHGGRGYHVIHNALLGAKVYSRPVSNPDLQHYHIEIPGQACDALSPHVFPTFMSWLKGMDLRYSVKRIDLAFDDVPFNPSDFLEAIKNDELISLAKRHTLRFFQSPYEMAEDGSREGTSTCSIGSNQSQRMVTVYDKRGYTRLEFQLRDERAHAVAHDIFEHDYTEWEQTAKAHLKQYIDFNNLDWWQLFTVMVVRADLKISSARVLSLQSMRHWISRQVAVSLSVLFDVDDDADKFLSQIMLHAKIERDRSRYKSVLQLRQAVEG